MNKVIHLSLSLADGTRSNGINPERRKSELEKSFQRWKQKEDTVWGRAGIIIIGRIFKSNLLSRMTAVVTCLDD